MRRATLGIAICVAILLGAARCAPATEPSPEQASVEPTSAPPTELPPTDVPEDDEPAEEPTATPEPEEPAESTAAPPTGPSWTPDGVISDGEYSGSAEAAGVTLAWRHDGEMLYAAISAPTEGWISVGFDPENRMQGANFIFGYVSDGAATLADMFGVAPAGAGSHPADEELGGTNDVQDWGGSEADGVTVIEFSIPLDSGDEYDRPLSPGSTYTVLLAFGPGDDLGSYHSARGATEITLE
jgi:hypothetical protein